MQKFKKLRGTFLGSMAAVFTILASNAAVASEVEVYEVPECYDVADDMQLSVNGKEVPIIETVGHYNHANFSFDGEAEITITVPESISEYTISPLAHELEGIADGNKLTFSLSDSKYLLIKINDHKELALAADDPETDVPDSEGEGIYNIAKAPYNGLGSTPETPNDALQRAIDDANRAGGGTVYVPNGVYYTAGVVLKSNVSLYLEPSAVIRGTGNWDDYEKHFHKNSIGQDGTWFITNEPGAENIRVYGRGYLDGNGHLMRRRGYSNNVFFTMQLSGLEVDGITFKDSGSWMVMINRSDDVLLQNVKFYNENEDDLENDAIDICESQDVLVKHAIAISEDDTYSTKTWNKKTDITANWAGEPEELNGVTFDDCLGWSRCCTFKVGDGCNQPQRNVTFQNSYSYKSMVAMKLTPAYAEVSENSYIENVTFENIDIEGFSPRKNSWGGSMWMQLDIRTPNAPVYNTLVKDIRVRSLDSRMVKSRLNGQKAAQFEWVVLDHIALPGQMEPAKTLEEMQVTTNGFYEDLIILPSEIPMEEKQTVLHDDYSTKLAKAKETFNVQYDDFKGNNGGGIQRISAEGDAYVIYDAQNADKIELRVNSYGNNKFPVLVYASKDEYGKDMVWEPVAIQEKEHGDYWSWGPEIMNWKWDTYVGSMPEDAAYVKIELPVPNAPKLWYLMLDDVLLYADKQIQPAFEIRASQKDLRIKEGGTATLYPVMSNIKNPVVTYQSDSPETVTVDQHGVINALKQGEAVITAELEGTGLKDQAQIYVYKEITDIDISESEIELDKGEAYQLEAVVTPEDSRENVTWSSTNDKVVSVTENGEVTALRYGDAIIMCETENHRRAVCKVRVARKGVKSILHDDLSNPEFPDGMLAWEATENLNYDGLKGATDGGIKRLDNEEDAWLIYRVDDPRYVQYKLDYNTNTSKLQDELVVSVSKDGEEWTPVSMSEVERTENIHNQWNQVCRINEEAFEEGIQYIRLAIPKIQDLGNGTRFWALIIEDVEIFGDADRIEKITVTGPQKIKIGEEVVYTADLLPEQAAGKPVVWSVTDHSNQETQLAEIDSATGRLKALETGEVRVMALAEDGSGISGSLDVEIVEEAILVDTIVIEGQTVLGFHDTAEYTALIFPENADNQKVEWLLEDMSHENIAVIDENGVVETGDIAGSFVIKASASDAGRAVGTLKVRVQEDLEEKIPVEEIEIQGPDQVKQGEKARYKAVATPANATKKDVVWIVENLDGKASISSNGTLTAREPGEVRIIAAATDGSGVTEEMVVEIVRKKSGEGDDGEGDGDRDNHGNSGGNGGGGWSSRPVIRHYPSGTGNASDWRKDERGWWLAVGSDGFARDEWKLIDGKWYFFDGSGYMVTGWKCLNRENWYYLMPDGSMAVGWIKIDGSWYYFNPSGRMAVNGMTPDGYAVDQSGRWNGADRKESE